MHARARHHDAQFPEKTSRGDGRVDMTLTTAITGAQLAFVHRCVGGGPA